MKSAIEHLLSKHLMMGLTIVGLGLLAVGSSLAVTDYYDDRIWPNTTIDSIKVGGLTIEEATAKLVKLDQPPTDYLVIIKVDDIEVASDSSQAPVELTLDQAVRDAFANGKNQSLPLKVISLIQQTWQPQQFETQLRYNDQALADLISELKQLVDLEGVEPAATLQWSGSPGSLGIDAGKPGRALDLEQTKQAAQKNLARAAKTWETEAVVASTSSPLSPDEVIVARQRAAQFVGKNFTFRADNQRLSLTDRELISLLSFPKGIAEEKLRTLLTDWAEVVNRAPVNAVFDFDPDTLEVFAFEPHRDGLRLNYTKTAEQIKRLIQIIEAGADVERGEDGNADGGDAQNGDSDAQKKLELVRDLAVEATPPDITLADTNNLGITERVGFGESWYQGSIASRTHNIAVATKKLNHTIIKPGEEYSFNKNLGEVSARTGFQQAYIIKGGATILGDGGGVCQVSSTLFRTLLDSGLDITRRLPHSYRVGYYEQRFEPGFDATVYSGNVDLRFINDTKSHLIIHAAADSNDQYMTIELYGTGDGRTTEISDYLKWDARPAPPTQYIPDPSLAPGQTRRIETAVPGLKTKFTHRVFDRDGELMRENTYYSSYVPWAAKFLVGVE
jgi:vancomycin resistance protein YoaR